MDADTASAIAGAAAAVVAVGAAVASWIASNRSVAAANRSAEAEERSAQASEEAVELDRRRFTQEQHDRAEQNAPTIDVDGTTMNERWVLAADGTRLVGHVRNQGPGGAVIESVELEGPRGPVGGRATGQAQLPRFVPPHQRAQISIDWPYDNAPSQLRLTVTYRAGDSDYQAAVEFDLLRKGSDPNDQPLYAQGEQKRRSLA